MIITITNGKGGTGKTTLNLVLAIYLFRRGNKVLLIDIDPNCSASEALGKILCRENSRQLLMGRTVIPYTIKADDKAVLDLIPSDLDLDMLSNINDNQLKIQLKKQGFVNQYDYILIDPPGTWGAQTRNAVYAAESIAVVGKCSPLDFAATTKYFAKLCDCGIESDVRVVCNGYASVSDPDGIWEQYRAQFGEYLLESPVPKMNSLKRLANNSDYHVRADLERKLLPFIESVTGIKVLQEEGE